jgi:hypothetical protein
MGSRARIESDTAEVEVGSIVVMHNLSTGDILSTSS